METDVVIVGGGLCGLTIARRFASRDAGFIIVEAGRRPGGRVLSEATAESVVTEPVTAVDLGPTWFWPGQHRIKKLIQETDLAELVYEQFSDGHAVIEYAGGKLDIGLGSASMAGSYRLDGGLMQLTNRLAEDLPVERLLTHTSVVKVNLTETGVRITAQQGATSLTIDAKQVVLALPPRVVADSISFAPPLSPEVSKQLKAKATWMAAHAKFVAVFDQPFWREQGLSGDGLSQKGPLLEIHDASPKSGGPYALFGFVGIPATDRTGQEQLIVQLALEQINRMFCNVKACPPVSTHYKDWAVDPLTATQADRDAAAVVHHAPSNFNNQWDDRIIFAGTETAVGDNQSNGYLEGALESAERALKSMVM